MKPHFILLAMIFFAACSPGPLGKKVREPFNGNAYESNNRFFRSSGNGESLKDNIARGKADIEAKAQLAGQVNTTMKQVADQYLGQTENEEAADVADKFQSLVRQVMNTNLADLRKIFMLYEKQNNTTNKESGILTTDGVHLNEKGNQLAADEMWKILMN